VNRFIVWVKTYPYVVLIGILMAVVISVWLNIAVRSESRARLIDLQQQTLDAAKSLAKEKHLTDSISAAGDHERLLLDEQIIANQGGLKADLDTLKKELRAKK